MNFVAYCHIFLCICIIYDVIFMYLDFLGISLGVPLILVITLQDRKTLFCVFFSFQGPIRTQIDLDFLEDHYFPTYDDTTL